MGGLGPGPWAAWPPSNGQSCHLGSPSGRCQWPQPRRLRAGRRGGWRPGSHRLPVSSRSQTLGLSTGPGGELWPGRNRGLPGRVEGLGTAAGFAPEGLAAAGCAPRGPPAAENWRLGRPGRPGLCPVRCLLSIDLNMQFSCPCENSRRSARPPWASRSSFPPGMGRAAQESPCGVSAGLGCLGAPTAALPVPGPVGPAPRLPSRGPESHSSKGASQPGGLVAMSHAPAGEGVPAGIRAQRRPGRPPQGSQPALCGRGPPVYSTAWAALLCHL